MVADMDDFDLFANVFLPECGGPRYPSQIKLAFIQGKEALLRDESKTWQSSYLPKFAAMADQLRREAVKREEDTRPHLALANHFDELAMQPPYDVQQDDEEGPY
jgi:hypothetical protein